MSGFGYRSGSLHAETVPLADIAAAVGTPCYVYSASAMRELAAAFRDAFAGERALFCYAVKANSNLAVIRLFANEGLGADTVSGGEIARALEAGVSPQRIVYAGIAKTDDEIRMALATGILQFNVESAQELRRIAELAAAMGVTAPVALRVNPDVDAGTHEKISTGRKHDKFGIPYEEAPALYRLAAELEGIEPVGVHLHIGSQIGRLDPRASRCAGLTSAVASACAIWTSRGWRPRPWPPWSAASPRGWIASCCSSPAAPWPPRRVSS